MGSLAICETVLDNVYLSSDHGKDFYFTLLMPLCDYAEWQFAVDHVNGDNGSIAQRYFDLAQQNAMVAEWLIFAVQCKGVDAFHSIEIERPLSFRDALVAIMLNSSVCVGAVSRDSDFFAQQDPSLILKTFLPGAAKKMVESKRNGTTIINTGNNNQIAGRDMSQVYQNIAQTNDPEMARAIAEIGRIVDEEGNEETKEQFSALAEELEKANPKPGVLKAIWNSISENVPKVVEIASAVGSLSGILGLK
jgi:hypothetical protein